MQHVEEKKASDSIENVEQENAFPPKKIEGRDGEEKVNEEGAASVIAAESELQKKNEDEKIIEPAVVEAMKTEEIGKSLGSEVSVDVGLKEDGSSDQTPLPPVPGPERAVEVAQKESEETPKASDVPESSTEALVEKSMEIADASANPESELKEVIKPKDDSETSVVLGSALEDKIKPEDQSTITELEEKGEERSKESVATELAVGVEGEVEKKIETLEAEGGASVEVPKDEKSLMEPDVGVGLEDMKQGIKNDTAEVFDPPSISLIKDIDTTSITAIAENMVKVDDKVEEEKGEENIKTEESALTEAANTLDTSGLNSSAEVTKDSGDVEIVSEEKDIVKGVMPTSVETSMDKDVGGADSNNSIENPPESQLEGKPVKPIGTAIGNLEKAEEVNEAPKSDSLNLTAPPRDGGDKETDGGVTKQVVAAKGTHRGIMSKVKQLIVKLKKAIIGKSPSSKTLPSDGKGETKVK